MVNKKFENNIVPLRPNLSMNKPEKEAIIAAPKGFNDIIQGP